VDGETLLLDAMKLCFNVSIFVFIWWMTMVQSHHFRFLRSDFEYRHPETFSVDFVYIYILKVKKWLLSIFIVGCLNQSTNSNIQKFTYHSVRDSEIHYLWYQHNRILKKFLCKCWVRVRNMMGEELA